MIKIAGYILSFFLILAVSLQGNSKPELTKPIDSKIVLAWDKNRSYTKGCAEYATVISAPLYALENENGNTYMKELADTSDYLSQVDKPVWGMYTNGFNPDNTRLFITDKQKRTQIADSIVASAAGHKLGGVNIDFENMYSEDADHFTAFIKELSEKLHANNMTLSVDVTKINKGSQFYSMCYDRKELSKYADYIILMAYDQFPRTSQTAGPVSSIPWTEDAVKGILEEVPAEKLILGIPFYTRMWTEKDGLVESCPAISMTDSSVLISEHSPEVYTDSESGLNYFQFETEAGINKVWQENGFSVQKRCDIADKYNLSGIACWSLGFESNEAKNVLSDWIK